MLHFDTTITFRRKNGHAIFKRQLNSFIGDLKTVVNDINMLLINQHHNYLIAIDETRIRFSIDLRKSVFQNIISFVFFVAIRKILFQYQMLIDQFTIISRCFNVFIIATRLSCDHKIQKRYFLITIVNVFHVNLKKSIFFMNRFSILFYMCKNLRSSNLAIVFEMQRT